MKSAGKARSNGLYRHIRTSKEIIRNLLNDSFEKYKSETVQKQTFVIGYIRDGIMYEGESMRNIVGSYTLTIKEDGEYNLYIISSTSDYLTIKQGIINHERKKED